MAIFFPWGIAGYFGLAGLSADVVNLLLHTLKVFILLFAVMSVFRASTGRLQITKAVNFLWKNVFVAALVGSLLIAMEVIA